MNISEKVIEAVAVVCELTDTDLSKGALTVMCADLSLYPEAQVLGALQRCRRELKGKLTLAAVLERIEDGRPTPEEAWSLVPKTEEASAFLTSEMAEAFQSAYRMVAAGELVPARMAFLERYRALVQRARDARTPVTWSFTPGTDRDGRELVILDAAEKGRISVAAAQRLLPHHREDEGVNARLLAIADGAFKRLAAPEEKAA